MSKTAIASESDVTPPLKPVSLTTDSLKAVPDKDCVVSAVQGASLDSRRVCFEMALLSLRPESAAKAVFALPTPSQNITLGIQRLSVSGGAAIPHSLALTAGLIAHDYVPDEWLCGLITPATADHDSDELLYFTTFDSQGVYGRSVLADARLVAGINSENSCLDLLARQLKNIRPASVATRRSLEALYVDHERLRLDESKSGVILSQLSEALEILVEALPAPSSDLCAAGLRWLAAEAG